MVEYLIKTIKDPPFSSRPASTIQNPLYWIHRYDTRSTGRTPRCCHDVALDLRTVGQRNSGEEVKSVTCIDLDMNFFNMITMEKRMEKLEREAPSVLCPPTF